MDPFDVFVLDSLLNEPCSSTPSRASLQTSPLAAQTALAAFLDEMDALDKDLKPTQDAEPVIRLETDSAKAATSAFSLFAQHRAMAFAMAPPRPEKRKRRIRAKEEIDTLRDTAASLERDLKILKASGGVSATAAVRQPTIESTAFSVTSASGSAQKAVGVLALETNQQLRKTVEAQRQLSTVIGSELRKLQSRDSEEISSWVTTEKLDAQMPVTSADYALFYEALAGKLDAIYTQLDDVFAAKSLADAQVRSKDAQVIVNDSDRLATLQFRDEKILPFDFQSVCEASWRCAKNDSHGLSEMLAKDDDVLLIKKTLSAQMDDDREVHIPVRIVFKRFLSKHRMICVRMKPGLSDERMMDVPTQVEQLAQLVIPTYQQMISSRFQMIENLLLDKYL